MLDPNDWPLYIGAFFLIVGEWKRDNIYRTLAGACSMWALNTTTLPFDGENIGATAILIAVPLYVAAMWFLQNQIRPDA